MSKTWEVFAQSSEAETQRLDKLKIQNKIKCELCIYKYKKTY